jgi:hypothetical protein
MHIQQWLVQPATVSRAARPTSPGALLCLPTYVHATHTRTTPANDLACVVMCVLGVVAPQDIIDRMAADGVEPDDFTEEIVSKRRVLRSYLRKTLL